MMDDHHAAAALNLHFTQFGVVAAAGLIPHNYLQQQAPLQLQQQHLLQQQQQQVTIKFIFYVCEMVLECCCEQLMDLDFIFIWIIP